MCPPAKSNALKHLGREAGLCLVAASFEAATFAMEPINLQKAGELLSISD